MNESTFSAVMRESTRLKLNQIEERNARLHDEHTRVLAALAGHADPQSKLNCLYEYLCTSTDRSVVPEQNHIAEWTRRTRNDGFVDPSEAQFYVDRTLDLMASGRRRFEYAYLYSCLLWEWNDNRASCLQGRNNHHLPQAVINYLNRHAEDSLLRHQQTLLGPAPAVSAQKVDAMVDALRAFFPYDHASNLNYHMDSNTVASAIRAVLRSDLPDKEDVESLEKMLAQNEVLKDLASSFAVMLTTVDDWRWDHPLTQLIKEDAGGKRRRFFRPQMFHLIFLTTVSLLVSREFLSYHVNATTQQFAAIFAATRDGKRATLRAHRRETDSGCSPYGSLAATRNSLDNAARLVMLQETDTPSGGRVDGYGSRSATGTTSIASMVSTILSEIATDVRIFSALRPKKASYVVHLDFKSFGASLSHALILQLLQRLHFDPKFVSLVRNYLQAPVQTDSGETVTLQRGLINGLHMSRFLGELLLSFLDLHVAAKSGLRVRRIFDDIWIWDRSRSRIDRAILAVKEFASICGLELNQEKTGFVVCPGKECTDPRLLSDLDLPKNPIGFGFLEVHPNGDVFPSLEKVARFAGFMREDLHNAAELSVIEWAKRFNKNIAFFESSCGVYTNAFGGKELLTQRKLALDKLFSLVLNDEEEEAEKSSSTATCSSTTAPVASSSSSSSGEFRLIRYVNSLIKSRPFGKRFHDTISVPWLFMPISAGGLGIINPYLNWVAHSIPIDNDYRFDLHMQVQTLIQSERQLYDQLLTMHLAKHQLQAQLNRKHKDATPAFQTFEEFQAHRFVEGRSYITNFIDAMNITAQPSAPPSVTACFAGEVDFSANLRDFTNRGATMYEGNFGTLSAYYQHLVYRYLPILRKEFGSIAFLDTSLIPYGLISSLSSGSSD